MRHPSTVDRFLLLVGSAVAIALSTTLAAPANEGVHAFAQRTISGTPLTTSGHATLVGDAVHDRSPQTPTAAASATDPGELALSGEADVEQSFERSGAGPKYEMTVARHTPSSAPSHEIVLRQAIATALGTRYGFTTDDPAPQAVADRNFPRSGASIADVPDTGSLEAPAGLTTGNGWPKPGTSIAAGKLFVPIGSRDTLSFDSVPAAHRTSTETASIGRGSSGQGVTGAFKIVGGYEAVAAVKLDFNVAEHLVISSHEPLESVSTASASDSLAFEVVDRVGRSVFGDDLLGNTPSATRFLASPARGSETRDFNAVNSANLFAVQSRVDLQTEFLPVGDDTIAIHDTSTARISAAPEITSHALLATAGVCAAALSVCLRRPRRQAC